MVLSQLWPPVVDPKTLSRQVWDADTARRIPGVGRALDLYSGLISQMPMDAHQFDRVQLRTVPRPRPRFLEKPDLDMARALFVRMHVEDYLIHGNAAHLVTVRDAEGWPAAVKWFPAHAWTVTEDRGGSVQWWLNGHPVDTRDVVHVQNGADPNAPHRGVGVVERYVRTLDRIGLQEESERENLSGGQVPSVAVIAPQRDLTQDEVDDAGDEWEKRFTGPGRRPAILPNGTTVTPLSWSPEDQQATLARQLSLTDTSNMFNLDSYWLGAPGSSHTYRSPGPLFLMLLRTSLEPLLVVFEDTWSPMWLPRGRVVVFDRQKILSDDLPTTVKALSTATGSRPVMTVNEARTFLRLGPVEGGDELVAAPVPAKDPDPDPDPDPGSDDEDLDEDPDEPEDDGS